MCGLFRFTLSPFDEVECSPFLLVLLENDLVRAVPVLLEEVDDVFPAFLREVIEKSKVLEKPAVGLPCDVHLQLVAKLLDDVVDLLRLALPLLLVEILHVLIDLDPDSLCDLLLRHEPVDRIEVVHEIALALVPLVEHFSDRTNHEPEEPAGEEHRHGGEDIFHEGLGRYPTRYYRISCPKTVKT